MNFDFLYKLRNTTRKSIWHCAICTQASHLIIRLLDSVVSSLTHWQCHYKQFIFLLIIILSNNNNNTIINHIDPWWTGVEYLLMRSVNVCHARTKPLSFMGIWIPLTAKCSSPICLGYVSTWSPNCFKRTYWNKHIQKPVPIHQQHEISYCQSTRQTVFLCLTYPHKIQPHICTCVRSPMHLV